MYGLHPELREFEAHDMNDALGRSQGFDDIEYEWSAKGTAATQVLQKWIMERKLTSRVEDLKPSELHGKLSWIDWVGWILGILRVMSFTVGGYRFMMFHPLFCCTTSGPRWFKTKWAAWQKLFHGWQGKQNEYRTKMQKKAAEKAFLG